MANTKVTGDLIASLTIATGNIADNAVTSDKISGITTAHITEGSNLYYTDARADARITAATTSDLSEGTNLYYTDARARGAVSVSGNALSYNSSTGVITSNFEESPTFTGNVGIGAAASDGNLHVRKTGINTGITNVLMNANFADGSNGTGLSIGYRTDETTAVLAARTATGNIAFYSYDGGWSESMRIKNNGNVGIGTSSPGSTLELYGNTSSGGYGGYPALTLRNDNASGFSVIHFNQSTAQKARVEVSNSAGSMGLYTGSGANGITILNNSNVGIGTTSPGNKLTIASGTGGGSQPDSRTLLHIDKDGEAYISINSPAESFNGIRLNVAGTPKAFMELYDNTAQGKKLNIGTVDARNLVFDTGNTERIRITSGGDVGIGTADGPDDVNSRLHVYKNAAASTVVELLRLDCGENNHAAGKGGSIIWRDINVYSNTASITAQRTGNGSSSSLQFGLRGAEKMRINSTGSVGIGTTSPNDKLEVSGGNIRIYSTNNANHLIIKNNATGTSGVFEERIKFLGWNDTDQAAIIAMGNAYFGQPVNALAFQVSGSEKMRITHGGDVLFGTTSTTSYPTLNNFVHINEVSGVSVVIGGHSGAHTAVQFRHNGASAVGSIVITASSTSYNTSSDYRLKENVIEMTGALDRVSQLKPSRFNFIADADTTVDGFLAHEVQEIVPEAISGEKDAVDEDGNPEYQGIDQSKLVPLLVSAIQELKAEIETLKTQINN